MFHYGSDRGLENPDKDFVLNQLGSISLLHVPSTEAIQEVLAAIPGSIDRQNELAETTFARLSATTGYAFHSNEVWKRTR